MAHPPEKRMELRAAYIGGLPLESAADKAGIPYATARNWFRAAREEGNDWDKFRAASLIVSGGGIEQAMGRIIAAGLLRCESLLELTADAPDPFEGVKAMAVLGDTVSKLKSASRGMMPEADIMSCRLDTLRKYAEFARAKYPASAPALIESLQAFGETLQ